MPGSAEKHINCWCEERRIHAIDRWKTGQASICHSLNQRYGMPLACKSTHLQVPFNERKKLDEIKRSWGITMFCAYQCYVTCSRKKMEVGKLRLTAFFTSVSFPVLEITQNEYFLKIRFFVCLDDSGNNFHKPFKQWLSIAKTWNSKLTLRDMHNAHCEPTNYIAWKIFSPLVFGQPLKDGKKREKWTQSVARFYDRLDLITCDQIIRLHRPAPIPLLKCLLQTQTYQTTSCNE